MGNQKRSPMKYKRDKKGVEISGDPDQIKWQVWFDLVSSRLFWVILVVVLLCTIPKVSWMPLLWQLGKKMLFSG